MKFKYQFVGGPRCGLADRRDLEGGEEMNRPAQEEAARCGNCGASNFRCEFCGAVIVSTPLGPCCGAPNRACEGRKRQFDRFMLKFQDAPDAPDNS